MPRGRSGARPSSLRRFASAPYHILGRARGRAVARGGGDVRAWLGESTGNTHNRRPKISGQSGGVSCERHRIQQLVRCRSERSDDVSKVCSLHARAKKRCTATHGLSGPVCVHAARPSEARRAFVTLSNCSRQGQKR